MQTTSSHLYIPMSLFSCCALIIILCTLHRAARCNLYWCTNKANVDSLSVSLIRQIKMRIMQNSSLSLVAASVDESHRHFSCGKLESHISLPIPDRDRVHKINCFEYLLDLHNLPRRLVVKHAAHTYTHMHSRGIISHCAENRDELHYMSDCTTR